MAQNPAQMMRQMQKLQEDMQRVQEELSRETVTAAAGGGAVTVTISGGLEVMDVVIDPTAMADVELLQDTIVAATNEAMRKAQETCQQSSGFGGRGARKPRHPRAVDAHSCPRSSRHRLSGLSRSWPACRVLDRGRPNAWRSTS